MTKLAALVKGERAAVGSKNCSAYALLFTATNTVSTITIDYVPSHHEKASYWHSGFLQTY